MKIVYLVTSGAGQHCGVCDYTRHLAAVYAPMGIEAVAEVLPRWSFANLLDIRRKYAGQKDVVFHLQYPSMDMGNSIAPAFIPFLLGPKRTFVTLHEFSVFHPLRKAVFLPFLLFSKIIFSNDFERDYFHGIAPFFRSHTLIVPIGANIPVAATTAPREKKIVYFGQIAEGKGIEEYLATLEVLAQKGHSYKPMIIGMVLDETSAVTKAVREAHDRLGLELYLGLPGEDVSKILQTASVAIMPFADGISEKRGSALACLKNGISLITRHSEKTPQWMRDCSYHMNSPQEGAELAAGLLDGTLPSRSGARLNAELAMREWPAIAKRHLDLYSKA